MCDEKRWKLWSTVSEGRCDAAVRPASTWLNRAVEASRDRSIGQVLVSMTPALSTRALSLHAHREATGGMSTRFYLADALGSIEEKTPPESPRRP